MHLRDGDLPFRKGGVQVALQHDAWTEIAIDTCSIDRTGLAINGPLTSSISKGTPRAGRGVRMSLQQRSMSKIAGLVARMESDCSGC